MPQRKSDISNSHEALNITEEDENENASLFCKEENERMNYAPPPTWILLAFYILSSVLVAIASLALCSITNVPSNVPFSQRINVILVSVAAGYPLMAFISFSLRMATANRIRKMV
jgi:hypothetical protein